MNWRKIKMKTKLVILVCNLLIFSLFQTNLWAQTDNTKLTKTLNRTFKVKVEPEIELLNKYGQVIVDTWNSDSVRVEVEVSAFASKEENAQRMLDRVEVDFSEVQGNLKIETILDRKADAISELWNKVTDFSKTVLSENNLHINFRLSVPPQTFLLLTNKFGDVYIDELGKANLFVSYGNLKINALQKSSTIELRFGSARIKRIQDALLKLNIAEVSIETAENLEIESLSSTVEVEKAKRIKTNSRNDKIRVKNLGFLEGKSHFTRFKVENLANSTQMFMSYGEMVIDWIDPSFTEMLIESKATDIDLVFAKNAYYEVDMPEKQGTKPEKKGNNLLNGLVPNANQSLQQGLNPNNNSSNLQNSRRTVGTPNGKNPSQVRIKAEGGEVKLRSE